MMKLVVAFLLLLVPTLVLADDSFSLAPPVTDVSVQFLGNLFGVVDGVLHGTGSQIMGAIFSVFNSAILAIGSAIVMYTLMVSTMNTAHEGQMLGQKWSSIWIPLRTTLGLALLVPKASGYCMMQIFVMWVIVQGIGAADRVWEAALGYLNKGGVIIQAQSNPATVLNQAMSQKTGLAFGAYHILAGQVCMAGLQKQLENTRKEWQAKGDVCSRPSTDGEKKLCGTPVPDFLGSVNAVQAYTDQKSAGDKFTVNMPNFPDYSPYYSLNGQCGQITWTAFKDPILFAPEKEMATMARAIGVQQMFSDLSPMANSIVNNDPQLATAGDPILGAKRFSAIAVQQFGMPQSEGSDRWSWMADPIKPDISVLFNGAEFQNALNDYDGIMKPTMRLVAIAKDNKKDNDATKFIKDANTLGWLMAGSYFFDLVRLNGNATKYADVTDKDVQFADSKSGIEPSICDASKGGSVPEFCNWLGGASGAVSKLEQLRALRVGALQPEISDTDVNNALGQSDNASLKPKTGLNSSSVNGLVINSFFNKLPKQYGTGPLNFANDMNFSFNANKFDLGYPTFECGRLPWIGCVGRQISSLLWGIVVILYNSVFSFIMIFINQIIMSMITVPIQSIAKIFQDGLAILQMPGVNPVVGLAQMGATYINFSTETYLLVSGLAMMPLLNIMLVPIMTMLMPILIAFLTPMLAIGFVTAYYVPILPYMIFTFGALAWFIVVIEAMVAAPLVALGVIHPEGDGALGKGESALMILMNVFLRPSLMIIGFIAGIALTYVGVWMLNTGFDHAITPIQQPTEKKAVDKATTKTDKTIAWWKDRNEDITKPDEPKASKYRNNKNGGMKAYNAAMTDYYKKMETWKASNHNFNEAENPLEGQEDTMITKTGTLGFTGWAGIFAFFFAVLIYTSMYLTIVQKSFTLIAVLPDKVLRWIGGSPESTGAEAAGWAEEEKNKIQETGTQANQSIAQMGKPAVGYAQKLGGALTPSGKQPAGKPTEVSLGEADKKEDDKGGGNGGDPKNGSNPPGGQSASDPEAIISENPELLAV